MAPAILIASVFAVEGVGDLLLAIAPVDKIGDVGRLVREARSIRRQKKHAHRLEQIAKELSELTGRSLGDMARYVKALDPAEMRALLVIRKGTKSVKTTRTLLASAMNRNANLVWISKRLDRDTRLFDQDFVRRFTFDSDMVREYTEHSARPSWRTLEDIVSKTAPVSSGTRASLSKKVTGLLGEHAAANIIRSPGFRKMYFPGEDISLSLARGVGYGVKQRSIDIVASARDSVVFAEVKNWAQVTWNNASKRREVLDQLACTSDSSTGRPPNG